jgi:hypothetical protein
MQLPVTIVGQALLILVVSKCMFCVFRPSSEVVKEGRILYAGVVVISTKQPLIDSGLFW